MPLNSRYTLSSVAQSVGLSTAAQIAGVGVDMCYTPRVAAAYERQGERFARRILTPTEWPEFSERLAQHAPRGLQYLASRFAAKEALAKALGTGIRGVLGFQAASVVHDEWGKPWWETHGELTNLFKEQNLRAHLSLSDEADWVVAFCVLERLPK